MTAEQLKLWRDSTRLTQTRLAQKLGVSRDVIANWESGRVAIPDDVTGRLEALDLSIPTAAPRRVMRRLNTRGDEITKEQALQLPLRACYWKEWVASADGTSWFQLWQMQRSMKNGATVPHCTPIHMDAATWTPRWT